MPSALSSLFWVYLVPLVLGVPAPVPVETSRAAILRHPRPAPEPTPAVHLSRRADPISNNLAKGISVVNNVVTSGVAFAGNEVDQVVSELGAIVKDPLSTGVIHNLLTDFELVIATLIPTEIAQATRSLSGIFSATPTPTDIVQFAAQLVESGLTTDNVKDLVTYVEGAVTGENSVSNVNTKEPSARVYPQIRLSADAPYSVPESQLRGAIHIPSTFKYGAEGAPQPILLVPGTGSNGYLNFIGNMIPLLQGSSIADPVWLNIPGHQLNDAQVNAEYVAYAIGYIHGISDNRNIAVASWSQGGLSCQWAYKYWPSTRSKVTDQIAFSPDYHGTVMANFAETPGIPLPPSFLQQNYDSDFVKALRSDGGDSAYVPTTNIYSSFFDEIVEPQQGTSASAYLLDARRVGVSNNEVQKICPLQPAGSLYTHEGVLYNPIAFALLRDALANPGPGQTSRIDVQSLCGDYLAPGLILSDLLTTENIIPIAAILILTYPQETTVEPSLMGE